AGVLGKDGQDELVERIETTGWLQPAEMVFEPPVDLANGRRRGRAPWTRSTGPSPMGGRRRHAPRAKFRNRVRCGRKVSGMVPVGPLRCFATMRSALPFT